MTGFQVFQQAQRKLDKNPNDKQAQFIVDLWNASTNLATKLAALTEKLAAVDASVRHAAAENDMLRTRLASLKGDLSVNPANGYDKMMASLMPSTVTLDS